MSEGEEKWTHICGERNMKPWHEKSGNEVDPAGLRGAVRQISS